MSVRIGSGKPRIIQSYDRWGRPEARWHVNGYGLISVDKWLKIQVFEEHPYDKLVWETLADFEKRIERQMSLSGHFTTCWEFDALHPDLVDRIRFIALFDSTVKPKLTPWTWADAHVRYSLLRAWCWVKNRLPGLFGWMAAVTDRS